MKKQKILITFIESGFGHITSARSISDSLKTKYGNKYDIEDCYIMKGSKNGLKFEKFLTHQTQATNKIRGYGFFILGLLKLFGGVHLMRGIHRSLFRKYTKTIMAEFEKRKPKVIVSTHYFLTFCASEYKAKVDKDCIVVTYNPDNNVHTWWDGRDIFINNNEDATKEAIEKHKFKKENVKSVPFTARKAIIESNLTKDEYREKLGIDKDRFCVVVADGGYALGKCKKVTKELLKTDRKITIVSVAGKNEKVLNYFKKLQVKDNIKFMPMPFLTNIYEYYGAADLFITKAGPNAILDCVYMGTPILVDYYPHPIEKATKHLFVDSFGCGEYISSPRKIRKRVEEFVDNPKLLEDYAKNTKKVDKNKNGANDIADIIDAELSKQKK